MGKMGTSRCLLCALLGAGSGCIEAHPSWQGETDLGTGASTSSGSPSTSAGTGGPSSTGTGAESTTGSNTATDSGATSAGSTGTLTDGGESTGTGGLPGATIFVTQATWTGNLGGLAGADAKCQTAATDAGLAGSWIALLSDTSTNAVDRVAFAGPLRNRIGDLIAQDVPDLFDGAIDNPVLYDELGTVVQDNVWTGSASDGTVWDTCLDWADGGQKGTRGISDVADIDWIGVGFWFCDQPLHLYCIGP